MIYKTKKRPLGLSFPDEVAKTNLKSGRFKKTESPSWMDQLLPNFDPTYKQRENIGIWQITFFLGLVIIAFFVIFLRLVHLQIVEGSKNRELADGNRVRIKIIHAPRGVIFDRNGKILAAASPAFRLFDEQTQKAKIIEREKALELEVKNDPRTADLEIDNVRTYPLGEKLAHVLGFVGEISPDQLKSAQFQNYRLGDRIGKLGIEAEYEKILRGIDGGEIIEVDSKGIKVRTLRKTQPIPGQNIYLSIDSDLQKKVYDLLKETAARVGSCCGAAVVQDPQTGQILALVSFPSFDPNVFTKYQDEATILEIFSDPRSPILNRAISGTYPPGSTFKIVSSLAGLASGISPQTEILDRGEIFLGTFRFANWYFTQYGKTEGLVNLVKALKRSTDTYFYEVGRIIGLEALTSWARKLYLGQKLGVDLPSEEMGLVPDNEWKQKTQGFSWYPGDTLHLSIGQGFVLTTPLQILGITSFIAADGNLYKPQLLLKVLDGSNVLKEFKPQLLASDLIDSSKIATIKQGLSEVPKQGGTAWPFFTFPIETAGKTGTAEYGDPKGRTHAWYTSFAPVNDPKIALTVLIEGGGEGSSVAAPIAKEAYRWYFSADKNKLIQDVYLPATESAQTLGE